MEVLVAMLVLAIALLGLAKLQAFGMKNTGNAYYKTQATLILNEAVESLRLNQGYFCPNPPSDPPSWMGENLADVATILPSGNVTVGREDDALPCKITVEWTETTADLDGSGDVDSEEKKQTLKALSMSISR